MNETVADIIKEMRGEGYIQCHFATKDGCGCYHCPFGSAAKNCVISKYADRLEAALKRTMEKEFAKVKEIADEMRFHAKLNREDDNRNGKNGILTAEAGIYEVFADQIDKAIVIPQMEVK